jgi:hypothetical protein
MDFHPPLPPAFDFILPVERFYASLVAHVPDSNLGGRLLYIGALTDEGRALAAAANIAGAASLAVIPGAAAQKQAVREGIVDFLVTDLSEALRILKNQIRKREPVAVCIASAPEPIEDEMQARGVLPDLLGPNLSASVLHLWPRALHVAPAPLAASKPITAEISAAVKVPAVNQVVAPDGDSLANKFPAEEEVLIAWSVASAPAVWLPRMDALAAASLPAEAAAARRWLRLAPRYTGRLAQGVRLLRCAPSVALSITDQVSAAADLRANIELQLTRPQA